MGAKWSVPELFLQMPETLFVPRLARRIILVESAHHRSRRPTLMLRRLATKAINPPAISAKELGSGTGIATNESTDGNDTPAPGKSFQTKCNVSLSETAVPEPVATNTATLGEVGFAQNVGRTGGTELLTPGN